MSNPSQIQIPHYQQIRDGYCLPACVQMILAALGIKRSQQDLGEVMGTDPESGTPGSRVLLLKSSSLDVDYREAEWSFLVSCLARHVPVITLVNTKYLSYWKKATFHAVVIVGIDQAEEAVWIHDPDLRSGPTLLSRNEFEVAWVEMSSLSAIIEQRK